MAVIYNQEKRIFSLQTKNTTYQMMADQLGYLLHLYYGKKVEQDMDYLLSYADRGFSGNPAEMAYDRTYSLDTLPQEYPVLGTGDTRSSALIIRNADYSECCDLRYVSHEIIKGKYGLKGLPAVYADKDKAETLSIILEDSCNGARVQLLYGILEEEDIITRSAIITNTGNGQFVIEKAASACLDFLAGDYELVHFHGRHTMERNMERVPVSHTEIKVESRRGASSHQHNPGVILAGQGTTEDYGACYGMLFVYSGSFMCETGKDQFEQTRILMGLQSEQFHYPLNNGESFIVPETILCFSENGFSGLSLKYHDCIRNHICRGRYKGKPRPVLLNSWEASYFDFDADTIINLAKEAASLGIDMVVMDDGWFGKRDSDNSGLGDWNVNESKLGCSMAALAEAVNKQNVKFGIWIEPEMVSEDSELYRNHPDFVLKIPGRQPIHARNQLVLDFSREEVREVIFNQICNILDGANIEYIKWDMNRNLSELYSSKSLPGCVAYNYVAGVYDFLEKLLKRYPGILIEGCCGGGGRFDAGMLYYTPQIWCSDNTDAIDRLRIQYGTSFFYPASTAASHVSAVPNHQTGRVTSLKTRGVVAMAGVFGYEFDIGKLSGEEKEETRQQIKKYKKYQGLIQSGDYYRLSNPFKDIFTAWENISKDGTQAMVSIVINEIHGNMPVYYVKLKGLREDAFYKDEESGALYNGMALMEAGLPVKCSMGEYNASQIILNMENVK